MRSITPVLLATAFFSTTALTAQAEINVVASIKPVHSLVAGVMGDVGKPDLIVEGAGSPHTYALKPSQAQKLENADLVFWIGHELEAFLEKPLEALAGKAKSVELIDAHGLVKLKFREGGAFDGHDHGEHKGEHAGHDDHGHDDHKEDHAKHDDHGHGDHKDEHAKHDDHGHDDHKDEHAKHDDHGHDDHKDEHAKHDDHGHDDHKDEHAKHDDHGHDGFDPHVWLDPINAKALVHEIEEALVKADPANAAQYEANAKSLTKKLDGLVEEVSGELSPVKEKGFVVFHDAYQSFENRFGLAAIGSITVSPEVIPGAERISELQTKVKELKAACVFSEPQFEPRLVATVTEGSSARTGVLDPLGTSIENGPDLYFTLIRNMATSFKTCLSEAS